MIEPICVDMRNWTNSAVAEFVRTVLKETSFGWPVTTIMDDVFPRYITDFIKAEGHRIVLTAGGDRVFSGDGGSKLCYNGRVSESCGRLVSPEEFLDILNQNSIIKKVTQAQVDEKFGYRTKVVP